MDNRLNNRGLGMSALACLWNIDIREMLRFYCWSAGPVTSRLGWEAAVSRDQPKASLADASAGVEVIPADAFSEAAAQVFTVRNQKSKHMRDHNLGPQ